MLIEVENVTLICWWRSGEVWSTLRVSFAVVLSVEIKDKYENSLRQSEVTDNNRNAFEYLLRLRGGRESPAFSQDQRRPVSLDMATPYSALRRRKLIAPPPQSTLPSPFEVRPLEKARFVSIPFKRIQFPSLHVNVVHFSPGVDTIATLRVEKYLTFQEFRRNKHVSKAFLERTSRLCKH